jgi:hypothetical protein
MPKETIITGRIAQGCYFEIKESEYPCVGILPLYDVHLISHLTKDREIVDSEKGLTPAAIGEWLIVRLDY